MSDSSNGNTPGEATSDTTVIAATAFERPRPSVRWRVTPCEAASQPLAIAITQRDDTVLVDRREARLLARALIRASLR